MIQSSKYIGIIGASQIDNCLYEECVRMGKAISKYNIPIICGGGSGVMEAVSRGVKDGNGITLGLLPDSKNDANPYIDFPIGTGIGLSRNLMIIQNADVLVVINGSYGTLSEIAYAKQLGKPMIAYKSQWSDKIGIDWADNIEGILLFLDKYI